MTGNKMTSLNLATIFGPNLLHKQKNSDKEFSVQSSARAEESTAVIAVLQRMIASYHTLFMVPPDLQNEVLVSLLETDPDVVDYLLRRKASQSPDLLQPEEAFSLSERRSSSDSNKASSGEVSPYDNNSPVLSERRADSGSPASERHSLVSQGAGWGRDAGSDPWSSKEEQANIWGTWHSTLKPALKNQTYTGSHGNMSEGSSRSSQEGLDGVQHVDGRLHRTQTSPGAVECRPHPPLSRACASPQRPRPNSSPRGANSKPHGSSGDASASALGDRRSPPPYGAHHRLACSQSSPLLAAAVPRRGGGPGTAPARGNSGDAHMSPQSPEWQDWQRDRWQIWQLLSSDNADTLPETLV